MILVNDMVYLLISHDLKSNFVFFNMAKANQNRGIPGIAELLEDFAQREWLILEDERLVFQPFLAIFLQL